LRKASGELSGEKFIEAGMKKRFSRTNGRSSKALTRYNFSATVWAEGKYYVSKCPELGVTSFGTTPETALQKLGEAVELYLENARLLGMLTHLSPVLKSK
jgi:predicted RNase H-like HicB family nuclease